MEYYEFFTLLLICRYERVDLFGAEPLGVFSKNPEIMSSQPQVRLKTWDMLEQQELHKADSQTPKNAFEEMILWTKQGKVWNFPINNEQGKVQL